MPTLARACSQPFCPGTVVDRGRCAAHQQSQDQRGYGREHRAERRAAMSKPVCSGCGCRGELQRDHIVPVSLGGSQEASNKRWLCVCSEHRCHSRLGARSDRNFGNESTPPQTSEPIPRAASYGGGSSAPPQRSVEPPSDPKGEKPDVGFA